jgi:hypothetical protein
MSSPTEHEPAPVRNNNPAIWDIVRKEMGERDQMGRAKHGGPLQGFNKRDALWDAYQEALDMVVYLRQAIWERDHPLAGITVEELQEQLRNTQPTLFPSEYPYDQEIQARFVDKYRLEKRYPLPSEEATAKDWVEKKHKKSLTPNHEDNDE